MQLNTRRNPPKGTAVSRNLKVQRESLKYHPQLSRVAIGRKAETGCCREFSRKYCNSILGLIFLLSQFPCFYPKSEISTVSDMDPVALSWWICDRWWLLQRALPQHVVSCSGGRGNPLLASNWVFSVPCSLKERWPMSGILGLGHNDLIHQYPHTSSQC